MIETIVSLAILILLIVDVILNIRSIRLMRRDKDKDKDNIYVTCIDRWGDCVHHANDSFACQKREIRIKGGECKSYQPRSQKPAAGE